MTTTPLAVVFDMDGLMFNTEELYEESSRRVLERRNLQLNREVLARMMGRPAPIALQIMVDHYDLPMTWQELQEVTGVEFRELLQQRLAPMPGLMRLLDALEQANRPKAVATSSRSDFANLALGRFDLPPRFQFILTGESVVNGKPAPDIYLLAAERLALAPEQILVLEDSENGCRAAVASGAMAVAVPGPHSAHHNFDGAAMIADSLNDRRLWEMLGV